MNVLVYVYIGLAVLAAAGLFWLRDHGPTDPPDETETR